MKTTLTALALALGFATAAAPLVRAQDYDDWRYSPELSDYRNYHRYDDDHGYWRRYCHYGDGYRCRAYNSSYWRDDDYWRRAHRYCYWRYDRRICRWEY